MSTEQDLLSEYGAETNPARKWYWVLLGGLISVGLGVIVIAWPSRTLLVLVVLAGVQLLAIGIFRMFFALGESSEGTWVLFLVGVLGIIAGIFVMRRPSRAIEIFVIVVGLFWILSGLVDAYQGIRDKDPDFAFVNVAGGVITAVGGVILLLWPDITLLVIALVIGLTLIASGLVQMVLSLRLRSAQTA